MSKNPTMDQLQAAYELRSQNMAWPEVLEATKLNYSQAWYFCTRQDLPKSMDLAKAFATDPGETVKAARKEANNSWGFIAVRCNVSESAVRRAYTEATSLKSQGCRIGKGGRWLYSDQVLYNDVLRPTGTDIPKDAVGREGAEVAAGTQRIHQLDFSELKNLAADYGIEFKGGTKVSLAKKVLKAMGR